MASIFNSIIAKTRTKEIDCLIKAGLTLQDAEDVFQDAAVVLYDVMSSQRLTMKGNPEAYLHGICQNMAHKRLEELQRLASFVDDDKLDRLLALTEEDYGSQMISSEDDETVDYHSVLNELLDHLSSRDFSIIHGFYIEGKTLETLANENNMASVEVARTTKCRIISRMREQASNLIKSII